MYAYIVRRVIYAFFILIGVNLITFVLFFKVIRLTPMRMKKA